MEVTKEFRDILKIEGIYAKGFGTIAKMAMIDQNLTIEAKAIYSYFCSYAGAGATAFPGVKKIIADLQISEDRYYSHFYYLKAYGYIKVEQNKTNKGKFTSNIYTLCMQPVINNDLVKTLDVKKKKKSQIKTTEKPYPENKGTDKLTSPSPEFPGTENQGTNINSTSFKTNSIDNISPEPKPIPKRKKATACELDEESNSAFIIVSKFYKEQYKQELPVNDFLKLCALYNDTDIIIQAIQRAKEHKGNSIKYILTILGNWVKEGITSVDCLKKQQTIGSTKSVPNKGNFEQRQYEDNYFESLYYNFRQNPR